MMNGAMNRASVTSVDMAPDQRSMSAYFNRIDTLTAQTDADVDFSKEATRKHWKTVDNSSRCASRSCRKQFSLLERPHHCRRCGDVFCTGCLKYRRKLNQLANIDPQGRPYKVCKTCYEEGQTTDGCMRDVSTEFARVRRHSLQTADRNGGKGRHHREGGWRNRIDFDQECDRLVEGFRRCVGKSEFRRTLHEMKSMVSLPEWQKSSVWLQESTVGSCQVCTHAFGWLRKRHFCKVCGLALCKSCSTTDLLVYVPDDVQAQKEGSDRVLDMDDMEPLLAIIKIVGCPEVEPEVSLYLRVCSACREELIGRQVQRAHGDEALTGSDMMTELAALHARFSTAETNVNTQLRDYQEITDSLEDNSRSSSLSGSGSMNGGGGSAPHSNMRTLAKAQEDLTDFLAQHVLLVQRLKRLAPQTDTQSRLLKNYIRAKCDFYLENMSTFRQMKKKLSESSPPEVLEFIQRIMDKNAIISAHLYLRQLVYESIHLCDKYELQEVAPTILVSLEQVIEEEVSACLRREGEDVGQHLELMKEMIRTQMKEHKLIRPSRRTLREHGRAHVQQIMASRTKEVLDQVNLQLRFKSANRSFPAVKQALDATRKQLSAA